MRATLFGANSSVSSVAKQLPRVQWLLALLMTGLSLLVALSEAMNPALFDANNSFTLRDPSNSVVPGDIKFSTDYKTVTLHPKSNLAAGGATYYMCIGYFRYVYDLGRNHFPGDVHILITHEGGTGTNGSDNWVRISTYREFRGHRL